MQISDILNYHKSHKEGKNNFPLLIANHTNTNKIQKNLPLANLL
jgi:hypothetical protein